MIELPAPRTDSCNTRGLAARLLGYSRFRPAGGQLDASDSPTAYPKQLLHHRATSCGSMLQQAAPHAGCVRRARCHSARLLPPHSGLGLGGTDATTAPTAAAGTLVQGSSASRQQRQAYALQPSPIKAHTSTSSGRRRKRTCCSACVWNDANLWMMRAMAFAADDQAVSPAAGHPLRTIRQGYYSLASPRSPCPCHGLLCASVCLLHFMLSHNSSQ